MVSPDAILHLPYDASLTMAGIEYAKKSLHYTYNRMRLGPAARLRKIVAGIAVELAFQRWLSARGVPFDRLGMTPFTERDRYDLRLGGRRCDLKSFLIGDRVQISALRRDPAWLLDAAALVPEDQFRNDSLDEGDFYLFGFLAGLETRGARDLQRVIAGEQPMYLLHTFSDPEWIGPDHWRSLGRLVLKTDTRCPIEVEMGGQDRGRAAMRERLVLAPRQRTVAGGEFFSLLYLHVPRLPGGTLGVRSPVLKKTRLVHPADWVNIWVYGIEIFVAGWMTKAEFRRRSRKLPAGSPVKQYARTQTDNRYLPVRALRPVGELVDVVRRAR